MTQSPLKSTRRFFRLPDSLFGQLLFILFFGIVILQASNFEVVCNVQRLYVRQAEKSRAEQLATYWFLFNAMTGEQRRIAIDRMADSRRPEKLREMVELLPLEPDWPDRKNETDDVERLLEMVEDSFGMKNLPPL